MKNMPKEVYLVRVEDGYHKLTNYSIGSKSHARAKVGYVKSLICKRTRMPEYYPDGPEIKITVSKVPAAINWEDVTDQFI